MKIKFLQNTLGAKDLIGNSTFEYQADEIYELPDELAKVFTDAKLAVVDKDEKAIEAPENKGFESAPENKSFKKKKESSE